VQEICHSTAEEDEFCSFRIDELAENSFSTSNMENDVPEFVKSSNQWALLEKITYKESVEIFYGFATGSGIFISTGR
jgi:hypothetical protein